MTCDINSIGLAIDPSNTPSFLLDWEVTKLCNLDCSYCPTDLETGGHNNSTKHPPLAECLRTIDFMYQYVDLYMLQKSPRRRKVILNVYGGESLFHPNIVEILQAVREKYSQYKDNWELTVCCTTNAIVGTAQWKKIVPLIDNFTLSYHSENLPKQKDIFKNNILHLTEINKPFRTVVMMHNDQILFNDGLEMIDFLKEKNFDFTPKPLDNPDKGDRWKYTAEQFSKLKTFWINKVSESKQDDYSKLLEHVGTGEKVKSIEQGRPCCGGRKLSINGDLTSSVTFVPAQGFEGWYCSVNWFFLYVQQFTGNVYINRDCRMNFYGEVGPIGNLSNSEQILETTKQQLSSDKMPTIQCKKRVCICGFCAPKAKEFGDFEKLMKYDTPNIIFDLGESCKTN